MEKEVLINFRIKEKHRTAFEKVAKSEEMTVSNKIRQYILKEIAKWEKLNGK